MWSQLLTLVESTVIVSRDVGLEIPITAPKLDNVVDAYRAAHRRRNTLPFTGEHPVRDTVLAAPLSSFGNDYGYTVSVKFGSQGTQSFPLLIDTGSSTVWVFDAAVRSDQGGKLRYHANSAAKLVSGMKWESGYSDGGLAKGNKHEDTMRIGNYQVKLNLPVAQHATGFAAMSCSGIIGLGLDNRNWVLPSTAFAIDLKPDPKAHPDAGGSIQFGGSFAKYGALTWVPLDKQSRAWFVPILAYRIGVSGQIKYHQRSAEATGSGQAMPNQRQHCALLDSGTTFTMLDDATLTALMSSIPGSSFDKAAGLWVVPCVPRAGAPDALWFLIGGTWFSLPYRPGGLLWWDLGNGKCSAAVQSRGTNECDILGAFFMHSTYAVFDEGNKRIGLAKKI
ncbi:Aspartic protease pep1 [Taphrina deformans PYCC 5710]|uniref:Aspartic protease pep1 n=1 Tax=Taphrina deformans (strain PYCC 5710 / ATCC 11124 / CBS 356.35 / IMI 108563 / JCM 9778 / NBRC 8474) TaxID=1097556 RepID=R4XDP2_TAPDE|nr:Aspartic protease pep1 [Taphrina deformans PYCC 5710]|eukprot:CCG81459.1 Aspartic protease pep1 [Taphrina deformans PYCC 5710]